MPKCIKCGEESNHSICSSCADELLENMTSKDLLAHALVGQDYLNGETDPMQRLARYTPEIIQVFPLDMEKLNQAIDNSFHEDGGHPAKITYRAHGTLALMRQPKLCIIDDEFIGHALKDKVTFYIYL